MVDVRPVEVTISDHVNMFVRDLEESISFYERLFGTDPEIKASGTAKSIRWAIIGLRQRFYFCFYERSGLLFDPDAMHINHIGFHVADFDETVRRVRTLGVEIRYGGEPVPWHGRGGNSRSLYVLDPNGYTIEFSERVGGGLDG
jgi:lactoylglutathione lyase